VLMHLHVGRGGHQNFPAQPTPRWGLSPLHHWLAFILPCNPVAAVRKSSPLLSRKGFRTALRVGYIGYRTLLCVLVPSESPLYAARGVLQT